MVGPVEQALRHVRLLSDGGPIPPGLPVTLNFHPDTVASGVTTIELLAREGTYRSQFETGSSNGGMTAYPGGDRWVWESRIFGGAYDGADPPLRPKYGALNHRADPVGGSRRFGSCHLRLRPHVLARTTFCYPDSYMRPEHFGVADHMALIEMAEENRLALDPLDNYVEAHVHGTLHIAEDAEAFVLDPCYRSTPTEAAALALPCAVEWHTGFRLSVDRLGDCERYRGTAAAEAITAISTGGFVTPLEIGAARRAGMGSQLVKWAWHCVARFGRN
jgi:Protein of unknown function (DUF3626)